MGNILSNKKRIKAIGALLTLILPLCVLAAVQDEIYLLPSSIKAKMRVRMALF